MNWVCQYFCNSKIIFFYLFHPSTLYIQRAYFIIVKGRTENEEKITFSKFYISFYLSIAKETKKWEKMVSIDIFVSILKLFHPIYISVGKEEKMEENIWKKKREEILNMYFESNWITSNLVTR